MIVFENSIKLVQLYFLFVSLFYIECQDRRSRSEALSKKLDRRRPASLDLNNATTAAAASSPRLASMKKASAISSRKSGGTFPSPGTPNYRHASVGMQKGWSSERVPSHSNGGGGGGGGNRRQLATSTSLFWFVLSLSFHSLLWLSLISGFG